MNIFTKWFTIIIIIIIIIKVFPTLQLFHNVKNIPNKERVAVSKSLSCSVSVFSRTLYF